MIDLSEFKGQRIAVMGLGKTGLSAALSLVHAGVDVWAWDDLDVSRHNAIGLGIPVVDLTNVSFDGVDLVIWSPGIPHTYPTPHPIAERARAACVPIVCDIDVLCRVENHADYIGVTGTNGKSTTTALIGHTLKEFRPAQIGGNIGVPVLDLEPMGHEGTYVLELSSYQTELSPSFSPAGVVFLNVTPDHLYRHGGLEGYIEAKKKIFANPPVDKRKPVAVICIDTEDCYDIAEELEEDGVWTVIPVSTQKKLDTGVYVDSGLLYEVREGEPVLIADLNLFENLRGVHNHENIACAYGVIRQVYGYEPDKIIEAMSSFGGLPHRQFLVKVINDVSYINDSKATNADATARALACFRRIYWILGGQPKEGGLSGLEDYMNRIERAYLIGEASAQFAKWLGDRNVPFLECGTLDIALAAAHLDAQANRDIAGIDGKGVVLLSPACASWDQFKSFEHRGDMFAELVQLLKEDI
jgi:UDP-N-acetylmuramoylalanine--D-glutamate ligase